MRHFSRKIATIKDKWKKNSGAALVEFAIVLPLFLLLVFGMVEFSLIVYNKQILTNACREGARAGVQQASPPNTTRIPNRYSTQDIKDAVNDYCSAHLVTFSNNKLPTFPPVTNPNVSECPVFGSPKLQVIVSYDYKFLVFPNILKLINGTMNNTMTLTADTIMTCE